MKRTYIKGKIEKEDLIRIFTTNVEDSNQESYNSQNSEVLILTGTSHCHQRYTTSLRARNRHLTLKRMKKN